MNRLLRKNIVFPVLASVAAVSLAACGGGGSHSALPQAAPLATAAPAPYTGPLADTMFTITIPLPKSGSAAARSPKYVSASTTQLRFTLISATAPGLSTAPQISSFNTTNLGVKAITLGSAQCPGSGPWTCTLPLRLPPGLDNVKISAENSSNAVYAQQQQNFTVTVGIQNNLTTVLDANVATMALNVTSGFCAGTFTVANSGSVATVGTTSVSFNASYKDSANNTIPISTPGRPVLKVNGHTDDNGGLGYSDPSNLNVKVTQSTQSFVLTKTDGTGSAPVAVTIAPPNTNSSPSDGLVFTSTPGTTSFTFQAGPAPPASLLADAEQILDGNNATTGGVIHLWTIGGGGSSFNANSPAALSAQPPPGPANSDVDFPNDLTFDGNSDLLIANGGSGSPDFGNFACVPAGSITTTANNATILTNNLDDPTHLAFSDPRSVANGGLAGDSSVALSNAALPAAGGYSAVEFVLSGTYTAAATTRDVARVGNAAGISVAALAASPTNPAGSYAASTFEGSSKTSKVQIIHPDGTTITLTDTDIAHATLAYDKKNGQLIVVSDGRSLPSSVCTVQCYKQSNIQVWNVNPVSKAYEVKPINITDQPTANPTFPLGPVDVSSDGTTSYVAVAVSNRVSNPELNVYTNSGSALTQVGSSLDYGASDCASGGSGSANYFYGGSSLNQNTVTTVKFLGTLNRLLVGLESEQGAPPSSSRTTANGMYIYDVTNPTMAQTGTRACDGDTGIGLGATTVNQTAFQVLSNRPLAAAYKP